MNPENKICQNCKQNFTIESEDFDFYKKIDVPAPTWCPECNWQKKILFRNERTLYKRRCNAPGHSEELVSIYSPSAKVIVYDREYWWSDAWDPLSYRREYDFSKPFFEQLNNLIQTVPWPSLVNTNSTNSDYCSSVINLNNCYMVFSAANGENCLYSNSPDFSKECIDVKNAHKSELCYEVLSCHECYRVTFSAYSQGCSDCTFIWDCRGCSFCFGCIGLRNQSYHIFNKRYSKEEYFEQLKHWDPGDYRTLNKMRQKFESSRLNYPHKYARIDYSQNVSGGEIYHGKNCQSCFEIHGSGLEDSKYILHTYGKPSRNCFASYGMSGAENCYESISIRECNHILFSKKIWTGHHAQYSYNCYDCNYVFGCIGLRNKQYCILNKQYTKEEYEELVPKIIEHMNNMPYVDSQGRIYKYGEFFPPELSPFCYNETIAQEYFPLTKEEALSQGYRWKDPEERNYTIDIKTQDLPDHIKDVDDSIIGKVIECQHQGTCNEQCTEAFKIIEPELQFYRTMNLPLPRLCPNCRHYQRLKQRNPLKLWHRKCECEGQRSKVKDQRSYTNTITHQHGEGKCPNEFETSYAPDRPEIVYCESCYNSEVV